MGGRTDKGKAVTRYLTGSTGIPMLRWDGLNSAVTAPYPYVIDVTTSRKLDNWHDLLRQDWGIATHMAIRYDFQMDSVADAWVGMSLRAFAPLLKAHYEAITERNE